MTYSGSCHCGTVTFTVQGDAPTTAISCNCSHCRRKGMVLSFVSDDQFAIDSGAEALRSYWFNKEQIEHRFCTTCGTQPFARGTAPGGGPAMAAINLRCVPAIDLDALELQAVDGARF
jgi:hypothetical protein